jgi:catechol 2,3-dioxygenase-like lactoylglutathione lyase family enzyme
MFSHVFVGVSDFPRSFEFYSSVMDALGLELKFRDDARPWAAWKTKDQARPLFIVGVPYDRDAAAPGNGQMVAFLAQDRATVHSVYAEAIAQGASCEGPPGLRPHYHTNYYGAYFRDPDGNKICVCCHGAEPD